MAVLKENWGSFDGYAVHLFTLKNKDMTVRLTNFGAAIVGIDAPDKNGELADIVLGYDNLDGYISGTSFQGAMVGRYANRIGGAAFKLNGREYQLSKNDGDNCLHGGSFGFNRRVWDFAVSDKKNSVVFAYFSPDGEEGFPGALVVTVKYTLTKKNRLKIKYEAHNPNNHDDTIFAPTNHAYFNLKGKGSVLETILQIKALNYTPFDEFNIPTGEIECVMKTPFNFLKPKRIGAYIEKGKIDGYDHNFLLGKPFEMKKAAVAYEPESGRIMAVYTDMPAMQFYTANGLSETGKGGEHFGKQEAFCLETQFTPDTPNLPNFPSCVIKRGKKVRSTTIYAFGVKG
jgi:aldose 1-epimerase